MYGAYGSFCCKLRCASNVVFSCSLLNLTVLRELCAPQTHPMGFVKSTHRYVLRARTPHEFFRIYCWIQYWAPNKKLEKMSSLDCLFENGCVLH